MEEDKRSKLFQAVDYLAEMAEKSTEEVEEREEIGQSSDMLIDFLNEFRD